MSELREFQLRLLDILIEIDKIFKDNDIKYFLLYGSALGAVRHNGFIPWDDDIDIGLYRKDFERMEEIIQDCLPKYLMYCKVGENKIPNAPIGYLYDISDINKPLTEVPTIDFFPIDNIPDNNFLKKIQKIFANVYHLCVYRNPARNRGKIYYYLTKFILAIIPNFLLNKLEKLSKNIVIYWKDKKTKRIGNILAGAKGEKDIRNYSEFNKGILKEFEGIKVLIPEQWDKYLKQVYGEYMQLPPKEKQKPHHKEF